MIGTYACGTVVSQKRILHLSSMESSEEEKEEEMMDERLQEENYQLQRNISCDSSENLLLFLA